jgi:chitodextrinase
MVKKDVAAGYTVTVTNQDGADCPATSFTLSYTGAPGGTILMPTTLILGTGQSGSATLQVKTGSSASYTLQVNAADNDGNLPSHATGTGSATFISDDSKPTTPTGLKATAGPGQVALTWNVSTDTLSGVQSYSVYRNNILLVETDGLNYTDSTTIKGTTYEYKVAARDRVGNVSALSAGVKVTGQ